MFGYKEGDFPVTEDVAERTIALPFFSNLKEEQIGYVVEKVKNSIEYLVRKRWFSVFSYRFSVERNARWKQY